MVLLLIDIALLSCWFTYIFSGVFLKTAAPLHGHREVVNAIWALTKWPALVSIGGMPACEMLMSHKNLHWWDVIFAGLSVWIWWSYRNSGDDDQFKKTKKRALERVSEVGGKLVVVPVAVR